MTAPPDGPPLALTAYATGLWSPDVVPAPSARDWMSGTDDRYAYRCLPLLIANQSGWLVLNNRSMTAIWSGRDSLDALSVTVKRGDSPAMVESHFGYGILTWNIPFVFRTPPGFNLLIRGPANYPKDGVYPLDGVVEADWASATFTMNWKITRPETPVHFEVGEPICMIVPQRRGDLEAFTPEVVPIGSDSLLLDRYAQWSAGRSNYITTLRSGSLDEGDPGWQRHYFQGRHATDEPGEPAHQTKLHLHPFRGQ